MFKFMCLSVFALANLIVVGVVLFVLKIGPVVATLSQSHGIHAGDLLAMPFALLAAGSLFAAATTAPFRR